MRLTPFLAIALTACAAASDAAPPAPSPAIASPDVPGAEFLPLDYEGEMLVDWARVRDCGLLERLERLPMAEEMLAGVTGPFYTADDLLQVRTALADSKQTTVTIATTVDGAERQPAPADWPEVHVGPHSGFRRGTHESASVSFSPRPGLLVEGDGKLLRERVSGDHRPGGPHPDLRPLLAGDRILFQLVYGRFGKPYDDVLKTFGSWFGDKDDPVDFVRLRLHQVADDSLVFALTLRFAHGTSGLRATEDLARSRLDQMLADRRFAGLRPVLGAVVIHHDGCDLSGNLVLGTAKEAVAKVEQLFFAITALQLEEQRQRDR